MVVIFDLIGTLFSLERLREPFRGAVGGDLLELWFARLLQTAMAATLADRYRPFDELAGSTLRQVLASRGGDARLAAAALEAMSSLEPWEDARGCLEKLQARGHRLAVLTNSGESAAQALLERAGLSDRFAAILSCDEAGACKPHPAPYRMALARLAVPPAQACMVAAHGWDVVGAAAVGLGTVWISRLEKTWPFPNSPPHAEVPDLAGVPGALPEPSRPSPPDEKTSRPPVSG